MKTVTYAFALLVTCLAARADVITLTPSFGAVSGTPGETIGWGFDVPSSPTLWISFEASFVLTESQPLGTYSDFIGTQGGPVNFVLPPNSPDWVEGFDDPSLQGVGDYLIDPSTPIGSTDSGAIRILYGTYSGDPNTCGSCVVSETSTDVDFQITVVSPEPSSGALLLVMLTCGGLVVGVVRVVRQRG